MRRPVCLIGLAFVVIIWFYLYRDPLPIVSLKEADRNTVALTGRVERKEYRISNGNKILVIYLKEVSKVQVISPQTEKTQIEEEQLMRTLSAIEGVICYIEGGGEEEPRIGSDLRIQGKLRAFARATNPGEFDAGAYYQILHLQAKIQNARILEESVSYDVFREGLWQIRCYFSSLIDACFEPADASVMKAMLLGEKSGLDEEMKQLYQLNGIIHILSISGLHISIIGMGFHKLLHRIRCPRHGNIFLSICFMYGYGIMTGMSISAIRAIAMFAFHLLAGAFARTYDLLTAMTIVAVSVLLEEPRYLYHSGFLFSFGAILAIGVFLPVLEENLPGKKRIEKALSASLAVSIVTMPVHLCFYYEYPLYALFLNLLIIPGRACFCRMA
ncbi:MAG: ComEC family competence protein [Lachnospiraceae bacterium]|nr:ComEC family competence protein [Lachnospiraceae bacterium]